MGKQLMLKGCGTALVTPFRYGEVDLDCYKSLVRRQVEAGIDFLVPLGTTAETPCLDNDEKVAVLQATKEVAGNLPVVVGCGTNSLAATLKNIVILEPHGADAYLVVVPYYNKPTQEGLYRYFKAIAESTDKGIVIYNVPSRTGTNMLFSTTLRLAEIKNIIAVKEASGNIDQILKIKRNAPEGFSVLSGNDNQTLPLMACGADGVVSVASNIAPQLTAALVKAVRESNLKDAISLNNRLMPLYENCFIESNPIAVKGGLSVMGLCRNELRSPLTPATPDTIEIMKKTIEEL